MFPSGPSLTSYFRGSEGGPGEGPLWSNSTEVPAWCVDSIPTVFRRIYLINRDREARRSGPKRNGREGSAVKSDEERTRERPSVGRKENGRRERTSGAHMVHSCSRGQVFVHEPSVLQIRPSFSMSLYLYTG